MFLSAEGNSRWYLGYQDFCRFGEHRDVVRVHHRLARRDRAAQDPTRSQTRLPGARIALAADDFHRLLPAADDGPAAGNLGEILRLAADRLRHLFPLRPQAQRPGATVVLGPGRISAAVLASPLRSPGTRDTSTRKKVKKGSGLAGRCL